jgi:hypothetical protein
MSDLASDDDDHGEYWDQLMIRDPRVIPRDIDQALIAQQQRIKDKWDARRAMEMALLDRLRHQARLESQKS